MRAIVVAVVMSVCGGCSTSGTNVEAGDAGGAFDATASEGASSEDASSGPGAYDGGAPAVVGNSDDGGPTREAAPSICSELPTLSPAGFCGAPAASTPCPSCAPVAYACDPGAEPSAVFVAGGSCVAVDDAGTACCTAAACTQTPSENGACEDGGLAFYCPPGASAGATGLHCEAADAAPVTCCAP